MKPQQKKLTSIDKITLTVLLEREVQELEQAKERLNKEDHEDNDMINQIMNKEINEYKTLIEKMN